MTLRSLIYFAGLAALFFLAINRPGWPTHLAFVLAVFASHMIVFAEYVTTTDVSVRLQKGSFILGGFGYWTFVGSLPVRTDQLFRLLHPDEVFDPAGQALYTHFHYACHTGISVLGALACYWLFVVYSRWRLPEGTRE